MKTAVGGHSIGADTPVSLTAEEESLPSSDDDEQPAKKRKIILEEQQDTPEEKREVTEVADCTSKRKTPLEESRD